TGTPTWFVDSRSDTPRTEALEAPRTLGAGHARGKRPVLLAPLVIGRDRPRVLLAPLAALQSRQLFRQRAFERRGKIDAGCTRGLEQLATEADVGGALGSGCAAG